MTEVHLARKSSNDEENKEPLHYFKIQFKLHTRPCLIKCPVFSLHTATD